MTKIPFYKDDFLKASEYLRLVLPFLSKYKIPASPLNYQVGYDFVSEANAALKKALEDCLEKAGEITEQDLLALHKQHIAQDDKALESVRTELQQIIAKMQGQFEDSNEDLSDYLNSLNGFANILSSAKNPDQLSAEVQKVMADTRSTEQSQRKHETQISNMMEEVEILRRQLDQVREESLTDALTGLANRKAFDQMLEQLIEDHSGQKSPFCVLIGDIDHFKKFNDTYGHLVGDKVLRYVANTIKSCVKGKDMAARFGGEEFVLILPDTAMAGAIIVAEQVRKAISDKNLKDKSNNEDYGKITISLGVGQFQHNEQPDDLLKRADQALYRAKENGRNRVEVAE
jgi:diguanylate cyclase